MLTTLHYYNHYRPFILNKTNAKGRKETSNSFASSSIQQQYKNSSDKKSDITYFLNKSLNNNVKNYMYEFSSNFNSLKRVSNKIYDNLYNEFSEELVENEDIQEFTSTYNKFMEFLSENIPNSKSFKNMSNNVSNVIEEKKVLLKKLGITISDNNSLNFDESVNIELSPDDLTEIKDFYLDVYEKICNFMKEPMCNHMEFKDFSYYFNYSGYYNKNQSFKIIEQGLLVDITL